MNNRIRVLSYIIAYVAFISTTAWAFAFQMITDEFTNRLAVDVQILMASLLVFTIGLFALRDAAKIFRTNGFFRVFLLVILVGVIPCVSAYAFDRASFYGLMTHSMSAAD